MRLPIDIALAFDPDSIFVEAQIVTLTSPLFAAAMGSRWWHDPDLVSHAAEQSIDCDWHWFDTADLTGTPLACQRVAVLTGDHQVQGAMIISTDPVDSHLQPGEQCLFVDQICTAPRNRPALRKDQRKWFKGIGPQLLAWGASLSASLGFDGRLWLLASPEGESTYSRLGFEPLNLAPVFHDGIQYKPMELPVIAANTLMKK